MFWLGKSISTGVKTDDKKKIHLKLSPLEVLILAQLRSREIRNNGESVGQYGYEMIQELNKLFAGSWEAKSGTIYPILSKLEAKKSMIKGERKKSPLGPVKKVYILEKMGREGIDSIIKENFQGDIEFIMNYMNLLAPFAMDLGNDENREEYFKKLMSIPAKGAKLAMENAITEIDTDLCKKKLIILKNNIEDILKLIEKEL